jgi:hypothetical protein
MINEAQEAALSQHTRPKQDTKIPFLINIDDARLVPNVPKLRTHPKYRPYHGVLAASHADRLTYLKTEFRSGGERLVIDSTKVKAFDIATATKEELITYAFNEFGVTIDPSTHGNAVRVQLRKLAQDAGVLKADHSLV